MPLQPCLTAAGREEDAGRAASQAALPAARRGKTRWWRKAPLELSHSSRSLLAGQHSFYLFCDGSAAKEQWFNAMQWGVADCGGQARVVEEMYSTFCHSIRQSKGVTYPQVGTACVAGS